MMRTLPSGIDFVRGYLDGLEEKYISIIKEERGRVNLDGIEYSHGDQAAYFDLQDRMICNVVHLITEIKKFLHVME